MSTSDPVPNPVTIWNTHGKLEEFLPQNQQSNATVRSKLRWECTSLALCCAPSVAEPGWPAPRIKNDAAGSPRGTAGCYVPCTPQNAEENPGTASSLDRAPKHFLYPTPDFHPSPPKKKHVRNIWSTFGELWFTTKNQTPCLNYLSRVL